jgi:1-deoxy-D-xylulose-5-phosphate reductoisomerase
MYLLYDNKQYIMSKTINLAILGSTGSIGQQTLDIVSSFPDRFKVFALAAGENTALLNKQIQEWQPQLVYSAKTLAISNCKKAESMEDIVCHPDIDTVVIATSGKIGLAPTIAAVRSGKRIALANKEALVIAGEIITKEAKQCNAQILPIDSEHSAIWQCLNGEQAALERIILTASGGPFYNYTKSQLSEVTVEKALQHPTWKMGKKVTIDSATLMNKGLEAIEAHWLFSISFDKIDIIIHPDSIVHSLVEFSDGSVKAQLSPPDMHLPIQYALSHPERLFNPGLHRLDLTKISTLTFEKVNFNNFPCLSLALEAGKQGGTYPAVLCAADDIAVELFLNERISFLSIPEVIAETVIKHKGTSNPTLDEILIADEWARDAAIRIAKKRSLIC